MAAGGDKPTEEESKRTIGDVVKSTQKAVGADSLRDALLRQELGDDTGNREDSTSTEN